MRVSAQSVCCVTSGAELVCNVSVDVPTGTLVAIVGPNGAGKTTLLRLLSGDLRPTSGRVTYDGIDASTLAVRDLASSRSFLEQRQERVIEFSVRQVVEMGRYVYRNDIAVGPMEDRRAVNDALYALDLTDLERRSVASLSGGEQQRVALARVLAQETPLILLDEPTTALDIAHQEMVTTLLRTLARSGRTVVAVLHDLNTAAAFDRMILLERGRVAEHGAADDVLDPRRLTRVYGHPIEVVQHPLRPGLLVLPSVRR